MKIIFTSWDCIPNDFKGQCFTQHEIGEAEYWLEPFKIRHCETGPAVIWDSGSRFFFVNNKRHRINGAAIELCDGEKEYYIHGKQYFSELEYWNHPLVVEYKLNSIINDNTKI